MAEERLIDRDDDPEKNKKFRFHINEDGEEELVLGEYGQPSEDAPEQPSGEGYAYATEESYREMEEEAVEKLLAAAAGEIEQNNFSTALEHISAAHQIAPQEGRVAALRLAVYTRNMTDFSPSALPEAVKAARDVTAFCTEGQREELALHGASALKGQIDALAPQVEQLNEVNERGKAERAVRFNADYKRALIRMICLLVPLCITIILAVYFSTIMYANTSGVNIVLTIVFAIISAVLFFVCVFAARSLNITARRVRMNKRNACTQVGRDYEAAKNRLESLRIIYDAVTPKQ